MNGVQLTIFRASKLSHKSVEYTLVKFVITFETLSTLYLIGKIALMVN